MSAHEDNVERLSGLVGVAAGYTDAYGEQVSIALPRRANLLRHLGFPADTEADAIESLRRIEAVRGGWLPRLVTVESEHPGAVPLRDGRDEAITWRLVDEAGGVRDGRTTPRRAGAGLSLSLPQLRAGYYGLTIESAGRRGEATVISAPPRCFQPDWLEKGGRAWGLAAQIYSFRSERNLGIGSYADVQEAARGAGPLGASFLGLSPVHALFSADRTKNSPYSPSSRLFLETIHIDPQQVAGFAGSEAARLLAEPGRAERIAALREAALVDHPGVWAELSSVLEALWAEKGRRSDSGFAAFRRRGGDPLQAHATFEALSEHFRHEGRWWLGDWPEPFRDAGSADVRAFAREHEDRVGYHAWLQYLADTQLADAASAARRSGMSVGLYRDLAVGSDRGGSELWSHPDRYGNTLSIGAPPDLLAPQGQDWGLPPLNPVRLEAEGLLAFRHLVEANMRHAGAIRIDHAFQLQRLFLIPTGEGGGAGAYVDYPFAALLAVLRLESHRARALVIAEDLGTGPEGFSDAIMRSGVLSYRVLSFERTADAGFKAPAAYPRDAMTVITTHDLPTFVGWWRGLDTDLRQTLGIYDPERADRERGERVGERAKLAEALATERLLPSADVPEAPPTEAVMRFLARTPSALNAIQYEDVLGSLNQANMPGTTEGHPNWRRKLTLDLAAIDEPGGPLAKVAAAVSAEGRGTRAAASPLAAPPPRATYRLQFHKDFTFDDAVAVVPYIARLGVSHVYASPIQTARPGSTHGYDIVDHARLNPELGGEEAFLRFSEALKQHGLGLVVDIVPNHVGVGGADNAWWLSVLEWGALSPQAQAFDIDWERLGAGGKLVVPVLGDRYGEALEKGDLKLAFDPANGSFSVWHFEHRLPVSPPAYPLVLDRALAALDTLDGAAEVIAVSERLRAMSDETDPGRRASFPDEAEALKRRLAAAVAASGALATAIQRAVTVVNGAPGLPESFGTLHRILEMQAYRPAHWRVAASDINYRRFFDINGLAGIRVERPEVFEATHGLILRLVREGRIQGLRVDHVDGLADPQAYVQALQAAVGPGFFIVVEKILEPGEELRPWPISGTTGYDALNLIDGIFVDARSAEAFDRTYRGFTDGDGRYGELLRGAKVEILQASFASELEVLVSDLKRIADADRRTRDYTVFAMRIALAEIIARLPVYRSYLTDAAPSAEDVGLIESTVAAAQRTSVLPDRSLHGFAADALLGRIETAGPGRPAPEYVSRFRRRFQQLTGPVMAKALEDTLFYRYVRFLALNEVGGDPGHFGLPIEEFHAANAARARAWPNAMLASSTHDTKRGEDARGRLLALSEDPDGWNAALQTWRDASGPMIGEAGGAPAPDPNDQYMLLQSLLGSWPYELLSGDDEAALDAFRTRFQAYGQKALRESKRNTSWVAPNEAYEKAVVGLIDSVLRPGSPVLSGLRPLARRLAASGAVGGLSRTVLKCTLPGVPDIYQGTAFWDLSLVDPDNRRPVDYVTRMTALEGDTPLAELVSHWPDGRLKQRVLKILLDDRAASPRLYAEGDYRPIAASGEQAGAVVAFSRQANDDGLLTVVPRLVWRLATERGVGAAEGWGDTAIRIPPGPWREILSGRSIEVGTSPVPLRELFAALPVAVLRRAA